MIATLRGKIAAKLAGALIIDVAGVGYLVSVTKQLLQSATPESEIYLHTSHIVREDSIQIFGFESLELRELFDLLRSVTGVGPKTALAILSTLSPTEISLAVAGEESKIFESVSGVGTKTAKLITLTLAGKLKLVGDTKEPMEAKLISALQGLGWSAKIATPVVQQVIGNNSGAEISVLVRECLAMLSK